MAEWIVQQYVDSLAVSEGSADFTAVIKSMSGIAAEDSPLISRIVDDFLRQKYNIIIANTSYNCFTVSVSDDDITTIVASGYCIPGTEKIDFVCFGPTYMSKDGEYRYRTLSADTFRARYEENAEVLSKLEAILVSMISENKLFTMNDFKTKTRMPLMLLSVAFAIDLYEISYSLQPIHINTNYLAFVKQIQPNFAKISEPELLQIRAAFTFKTAHGVAVEHGQKVIPMYMRELMQPFDINFSTWRELFITQIVSELLINFIAPCFVYHIDWAILNDFYDERFDNKVLRSKYAKSEVAESVVKKLRDSRDVIKDEVGNVMDEFSKEIYEGIEYAQSHLMLSDKALLQILEHRGITMGSLEKIETNAPESIFSVCGTFAGFSRMMFELIYGLHCLHTKMHVIHGDLHINNIVITTAPTMGAQVYDSSVMYVAGNVGDVSSYIFRGDYICPSIIDYSRALFGPKAHDRIAKMSSPQFATNFFRDQRTRFLRTVHKFSPEYILENQAQLKAAMLTDEARVFAASCAIDYIALANGLFTLFENISSGKSAGPVRKFEIDPKILTLTKDIEQFSRRMLVRGVEAIKNNTEWSAPGPLIMAEYFADFAFNRAGATIAKYPVAAVWNINNKLKYSGTDYKRFPAWAQLDKLEAGIAPMKLEKFLGFQYKLKSDDKTETVVHEIAEVIRGEQNKLDGNIAQHDSSWLD